MKTLLTVLFLFSFAFAFGQVEMTLIKSAPVSDTLYLDFGANDVEIIKTFEDMGSIRLTQNVSLVHPCASSYATHLKKSGRYGVTVGFSSDNSVASFANDDKKLAQVLTAKGIDFEEKILYTVLVPDSTTVFVNEEAKLIK